MTNIIEQVAPRGVTDPETIAPPWESSNLKSEAEGGVGFNGAEAGLVIVSPGETPSLIPALSLTDKAEADARRVVSLLDGANEQHIQAGEIVRGAITGYHKEPEAIRCFVAVLVQANVLTRRDGELAGRSAKLSKLAKIGERADLLRRPEICQRVRGFSALYQAAVLLEVLPGEGTERSEALIKILDEGAAREITTRAYLQQETRRVKGEKRLRDVPRPVTDNDARDGVAEGISEVDLVLMTPTDADLKRIEQTFFDESSIGLCGRVHERCASSATLVAAVPLHALPLVHNWLLVGFERPRIFLAERVADSDVTDATVIIVATRGDIVFEGDVKWGEADDLALLAERIAPDSKRRLHVFADEAQDGWSALVGDANWGMDW